MKRSNALAVFFVLAILGVPALAAEKKPDQAAPKVEIRNLTIQPAPVPRPALKYRLLPSYLEQKPGNAAPLYLKSFLMFQDPSHAQSAELVENRRPGSLADKAFREQVSKALGDFKPALHELEMASRREWCHFDPSTRDEQNVYASLLPHLQIARRANRILAAKAEVAILQRDFDGAFSAAKTGFALARDIGSEEYLVSGLVGLTMENIMADIVEKLIAMPDSPNLYWAVTHLPDPLIDFRRAFAVEGAAAYLVFPQLREAKTSRWTRQQADAALTDLYSQLKVMAEDSAIPKIPTALDLKEFLQKAFPVARNRLIARGWKERQVDAMPPAQVVLAETAEAFEESRDDLFKWFSVPYWQARQGLKAVEAQFQRTLFEDPIPLRQLLLPAVSACHFGRARTDRGIATLRVIEAIRLYAANHDGKLPESLDKIHEVPIPINALTGKPFPYKLEGNTAILEADGPANSVPRQYRLTLAR